MAFTAQDVKALRDSSGAGMMDCKKALQETDGDMEAAKKWLREKGLAASAKREDRDARNAGFPRPDSERSSYRGIELSIAVEDKEAERRKSSG